MTNTLSEELFIQMALPHRKTSSNPQMQRILSLLRRGADCRKGKVRRLRAALREARYENDLKLSVAADRLLQTLEEQD